MKLVRFGAAGHEKPGILDRQGAVRDLSSMLADITGAELNDRCLGRLAGLDLTSLPLVQGRGECVGARGACALYQSGVLHTGR
jgi:2,4-diketo-3-deoxy-L-fuconate hydrolase